MSDEDTGLLVEYADSATNYSGVFDDGRVAYAYLLEDGQIIADVWLYNHGEAPSTPEWNNPSERPFANPKGFSAQEQIEPITREEDVQFLWFHTAEKLLISVEIILRGKVYGRLTPSSKPGWARLAIKNGPLAKIM